MLFKLKLFLYNIFHKKARAMVLFICSGEELPQPLGGDEELELLQAKDQGDKRAMDILIEHNLRLVVYIAKKYQSSGIEFEDLISIGSLGLIKAVKTFRLDKKIKLATYASRCIENEILMQLRKTSRVKAEVSLEKPLSEDHDGDQLCILDVLPADEEEIDRSLFLEADKKIVQTLLGSLPVREQEIIALRYGLLGGEELTQREVAEKLGISQSYISRIEKKILENMRQKLENEAQ